MPTYTRRQVIHALEILVQNEDGVSFQRLVRRLLRQVSPWLIPNSQHKDAGVDATIITPSGEAVVCVSLDLTFSKLQKDIQKVLLSKSLPLTVFFCTSVTISNATVEKWKQTVFGETGVLLKILERTWLVDECLRPENTFIVAEELRPESVQPSTRDGLALGPLIAVTPDKTPIYYVRTSMSNGTPIATWFNTTGKERTEAVYAASLERDETRIIKIGEGADPSCIAKDGEIFISWCYRPHWEKRWQLNVTRSDAHWSYTDTHQVCTITNLDYAAELLIYQGKVILAALVKDEKTQKCRVVLLNLCGKEVTHLDVAWNAQSDLRIIAYGPYIFLAVRHIRTLSIHKYNGKEWRLLWEAPSKETGVTVGIWRFDLAISNGELFVAFEEFQHFILMVAVINLNSGVTEQLRQISVHGKFPSFASNGENILLAWAGCPTLPLELQKLTFASKEVYMDLWIQACDEVRRQTEKLLEAAGETTIDKAIFPDAWSPLWLTTVSQSGQCVHSYGPLGFGARPNWDIDTACGGSNGVIAFLSGGDEDSTMLVARRYSIS